MRPPEETVCCTLSPFNRKEAISVKEAADIAGESIGVIYNWCRQHGIGRRVGGGRWFVSRVALAMLLDGDMIALAAYQTGERAGDLVGPYFVRFNLLQEVAATRSLQSLQHSQSLQLVRRASGANS